MKVDGERHCGTSLYATEDGVLAGRCVGVWPIAERQVRCGAMLQRGTTSGRVSAAIDPPIVPGPPGAYRLRSIIQKPDALVVSVN